MEKPKGRNAGKKYETPLSLHPMKFEDALKQMFKPVSVQFHAGPKKKKKGKD